MKREHYLPMIRRELFSFLADKFDNPDEKTKFLYLCQLVEAVYHFEFQKNLEWLKLLYTNLDPDCNWMPTRGNYHENQSDTETAFLKKFKDLIKTGNYLPITDDDLKSAFGKNSPAGIDVSVNLDEYEYFHLFYRGHSTDLFEKKNLFQQKKKVEFEVYSRVVIVFRLKSKSGKMKSDLRTRYQSDKVYIKLFKNVPAVDLEMIFPEAEIKIKPLDRAKVIIPLVAGIGTTVYKIIDYFINQGSSFKILNQIGFWTLVGSLFGLALRGFLSYKNTIERYLKNLTVSLYFQNLDNNSGVYKYLMDDAEEEDTKELLLIYTFLLLNPDLSGDKAELDRMIEDYIAREYQCHIDFDMDDALDKLLKKGLAVMKDGEIKLIGLEEAIAVFDRQWDCYFSPDKSSPKKKE